MRVIIGYKIVKGIVFLLAGLAISIAVGQGEGLKLREFALSFREHATSKLAIDAAELLVSFATAGKLALTALAIGLDGAVTIVEAWLLNKGTRLAILLVVVASSSLVPWELYELVRHFHVARLLLLVLNVGVVLYLGWQAHKHVNHRRRLTLEISVPPPVQQPQIDRELMK